MQAMIKRCPACGAKNPGAVLCRRCGCGVQGLSDLLAAARQAECRAVAALLGGDFSQARQAAKVARRLDNSGLGAALLGFLAWRKGH